MHEPWIERWQEGRIGWHQADGNTSLKRHWRATRRRVLVPLCGKTPDMKWLADRGNRVYGVELSALAIEAFFAEQQLDYTVENDELPAYRSKDGSITIYCGDYFQLRSLRCDAHYDRGALIALPVEQRAAYAAHTNRLLEASPEQLVITLDYDQSITSGPPFSVPDGELLGYWPRLVCVDEHDDIDDAPPKFVQAGLTALQEKVWRTP